MDNIRDLSDERLKLYCIHCGGYGDPTRDHVPSKTFLQKRYPEKRYLEKQYPENLPTVVVCADCNASFSADEEYLSLFLQCVLVGSTDPSQHTDSRAARALQHHPKLRNAIENSKAEETSASGEVQVIWKPDMDRVNQVIIKNGRGHALFECSESMYDEPDYARCAPLYLMAAEERMRFENGQNGQISIEGYPEVGCRMMQRMFTMQDMENGWIIVQDGIYRYRVEYSGGMLVKSVLYEYLATEVYWNEC